jgi:hypothetical protein
LKDVKQNNVKETEVRRNNTDGKRIMKMGGGSDYKGSQPLARLKYALALLIGAFVRYHNLLSEV